MDERERERDTEREGWLFGYLVVGAGALQPVVVQQAEGQRHVVGVVVRVEFLHEGAQGDDSQLLRVQLLHHDLHTAKHPDCNRLLYSMPGLPLH